MKKKYTIIKIESQDDLNVSDLMSFLIRNRPNDRLEILTSNRLLSITERLIKEPTIVTQGIKDI